MIATAATPPILPPMTAAEDEEEDFEFVADGELELVGVDAGLSMIPVGVDSALAGQRSREPATRSGVVERWDSPSRNLPWSGSTTRYAEERNGRPRSGRSFSFTCCRLLIMRTFFLAFLM